MTTPFVLVLHSDVAVDLAVDLARELDSMCISTMRKDANGITFVVVQYVPRPEKPTNAQRELLALSSGLRFIETRLLPSLSPAQRQAPAVHMAQLRKFTGQDWRGRR